MGRTPTKLILSDEQRVELQRRVRAGSTSQRDAMRAKIILASEGTRSAQSVADELGVVRCLVERWRSRFIRDGIEGLREAKRQGRPARFTPEQRMEIVAMACEPLPGDDGIIPEKGRTTRTIDELVVAAKERGIVDSIGWGTVQRLLSTGEIRPHRDQQWLHSTDPNFREKVTAICDLYLRQPDPDEVVLCIDEKPGMQALERKHPPSPAAKGRLRRREYEYKRHGTQTLIAAFNVHSGDVIAHCGKTRKADDLIRFMDEVAASYPDKRIHVIWDCLNIHYDGPDKRWTKFNQREAGRFTFTHTPKHASWVNQIECFFSILQRASLNRGSFKSQEQLRNTVMNFIRDWNEHKAHPFRWTFNGYPLQTGVNDASITG